MKTFLELKSVSLSIIEKYESTFSFFRPQPKTDKVAIEKIKNYLKTDYPDVDHDRFCFLYFLFKERRTTENKKARELFDKLIALCESNKISQFENCLNFIDDHLLLAPSIFQKMERDDQEGALAPSAAAAGEASPPSTSSQAQALSSRVINTTFNEENIASLKVLYENLSRTIQDDTNLKTLDVIKEMNKINEVLSKLKAHESKKSDFIFFLKQNESNVLRSDFIGRLYRTFANEIYWQSDLSHLNPTIAEIAKKITTHSLIPILFTTEADKTELYYSLLLLDEKSLSHIHVVLDLIATDLSHETSEEQRTKAKNLLRRWICNCDYKNAYFTLDFVLQAFPSQRLNVLIEILSNERLLSVYEALFKHIDFNACNKETIFKAIHQIYTNKRDEFLEAFPTMLSYLQKINENALQNWIVNSNGYAILYFFATKQKKTALRLNDPHWLEFLRSDYSLADMVLIFQILNEYCTNRVINLEGMEKGITQNALLEICTSKELVRQIQRFNRHIHDIIQFLPGPLNIQFIKVVLTQPASPLVNGIYEIFTKLKKSQIDNKYIFQIIHQLLLKKDSSNADQVTILKNYGAILSHLLYLEKEKQNELFQLFIKFISKDKEDISLKMMCSEAMREHFIELNYIKFLLELGSYSPQFLNYISANKLEKKIPFYFLKLVEQRQPEDQKNIYHVLNVVAIFAPDYLNNFSSFISKYKPKFSHEFIQLFFLGIIPNEILNSDTLLLLIDSHQTVTQKTIDFFLALSKLNYSDTQRPIFDENNFIYFFPNLISDETLRFLNKLNELNLLNSTTLEKIKTFSWQEGINFFLRIIKRISDLKSEETESEETEKLKLIHSFFENINPGSQLLPLQLAILEILPDEALGTSAVKILTLEDNELLDAIKTIYEKLNILKNTHPTILPLLDFLNLEFIIKNRKEAIHYLDLMIFLESLKLIDDEVKHSLINNPKRIRSLFYACMQAGISENNKDLFFLFLFLYTDDGKILNKIQKINIYFLLPLILKLGTIQNAPSALCVAEFFSGQLLGGDHFNLLHALDYFKKALSLSVEKTFIENRALEGLFHLIPSLKAHLTSNSENQIALLTFPKLGKFESTDALESAIKEKINASREEKNAEDQKTTLMKHVIRFGAFKSGKDYTSSPKGIPEKATKPSTSSAAASQKMSPKG